MPEGTPPLIGDFSGPADNGPRKDLELPSVEKERKEDTSPQKKLKPEQKEEPKTPTKEEEYKKQLERVGLTMPQAREIMASVLVDDVYREKHFIGPRGSQVECVIRSRAYADIQRAYRYLEAEKPTYPASMNDFLATYNVAASIERYGDKVFKFPNPVLEPDDADEAFQERLNFLKTKNSFLLSKLTTLVSDMDNKLLAVFAEGAPEDF